MSELKDNLLGISWHDSAWIPILNATNVVEYFSERSNPFYDRTCNNEIVKMQRLSLEQLNNMTGLEYILLHVQEPILFVIRKQHRHSSTQVTPLADYYIIAGVVYQAPDLASVVNSRLLNAVNHLQSAFNECLSYTRYHPSKGYSWEFKDKESTEKSEAKKKEKKEEPSSVFQRQRVDMLLLELAKKFPLRTGNNSNMAIMQAHNQSNNSQSQTQTQPEQTQQKQTPSPSSNDKPDVKPDPTTIVIKQEKADEISNSSGPSTPQQHQQQPRMKPPPEKRAKLS